LELVEAIGESSREDVRALVIGDGPGLERLRVRAGQALGKRILLPGAIPRESVPDYLAAMDVGVLPQSVDGVGSFRYTIKSSEYIDAGLPVVMSQTPMSYDLDDGWIWRLSGRAPWERDYIASLTALIDSISRDQIDAKRAAVPSNSPLFDRDRQRRRVADFIADLLAA
jgi:glycosyltransferase involved in cell wall biosynthesis